MSRKSLNVEDINIKTKSNDIEILEYKNTNALAKMRCLFCNLEFTDMPKSYIQGKRHSCKSNRQVASKETINQIILLYKNNETLQSISKMVGMTIGAVYNIVDKFGVRIKRHNYNPPNKIQKNSNFFDSIDTEYKAYILGILYADGGNQCETKKISIKLQNNDRSIVEDIKKHIDYKGMVRTEVKKYKIKTNNKVYEGVGEYAVLSFIDKHMSETLEKIGMCSRKSLILCFPHIPEHLHRHFIRGYVDGDGCLYKGFVKQKYKDTFHNKKRISLHIVGTDSFLSVVNDIFLKNTGVCAKNLYKAGKKMKTLCVVSNKCKTILNWIYGESNISMDRKYKKYLDIVQGDIRI